MKIENKLNLISFFIEMGDPIVLMLLGFFPLVLGIYNGAIGFSLVWGVLFIFWMFFIIGFQVKLAPKGLLASLPSEFGKYLLENTSGPINYNELAKNWDKFLRKKRINNDKQKDDYILQEQVKALKSSFSTYPQD